MSQFSASMTAEGVELLVMIGLTGSEMRMLQAASQPVPRPVVVTGIIDTGSNHCSISARIAAHFGLVSTGQGPSQTAGGSVWVDLYEVSLFLPKPNSTTEFLAVADGLLVSELNPAITGFEAIVGRDLLAQLLFFLNSPRNEFVLAS